MTLAPEHINILSNTNVLKFLGVICEFSTNEMENFTQQFIQDWKNKTEKTNKINEAKAQQQQQTETEEIKSDDPTKPQQINKNINNDSEEDHLLSPQQITPIKYHHLADTIQTKKLVIHKDITVNEILNQFEQQFPTKKKNECICRNSDSITTCAPSKRLFYFLNIMTELEKIFDYGKQLMMVNSFFSSKNKNYTKTDLFNDYYHVEHEHNTEFERYHYKECRHTLDQCRYLNDRSRFGTIFNQIHLKFFHNNDAVFRLRNNQNRDHENRFLVDWNLMDKQTDEDESKSATAAAAAVSKKKKKAKKKAKNEKIYQNLINTQPQSMLLQSESPLTNESKDEVKEDDDSKQEILVTKFGVLDFGDNFFCWNIRHGEAKFKSIEEEVTMNQFATISVEVLNEIIAQSKLLVDTEIAKKYQLEWRDIMCLKLYTDFSHLCSNLRMCYRRSLENSQRRLQFYHWAKHLKFLFDYKSVPTNKVLYQGISKILTIESLTPCYSGPVSLSQSICVGMNFAGFDGMLLELHSGLIGGIFYDVRGLDVSWISCYPNEQEFLVYDAILPIRRTQIIDKQNLQKQISYLNNLMSLLTSDKNNASLKKMIKHWLPVIVNNTHLFENNEMFADLSLFHVLFFHRRLYNIIMKPVLKYRSSDINSRFGSVFNLLYVTNSSSTTNTSQSYLNINPVVAQVVSHNNDLRTKNLYSIITKTSNKLFRNKKTAPAYIQLLTCLTKNGNYFETKLYKWRMRTVLDIDDLMDWTKIIKFIKRKKIDLDNSEIPIYYKIKVIYQDNKLNTKFSILSDIYCVNINAAFLISIPCFCELKHCIEDKMNRDNSTDLELKEYLIENKKDCMYYALYLNDCNNYNFYEEASCMVYLICKLDILDFCLHPKFTLDDLFDLNVNLQNQSLYANVDYHEQCKLLTPMIPKQCLLSLWISVAGLRVQDKEVKKFRWKKIDLNPDPKQFAFLWQEVAINNNIASLNVIDWHRIDCERLLQSTTTATALSLYYTFEFIFEMQNKLDNTYQVRSKSKVMEQPIGNEINFVLESTLILDKLDNNRIHGYDNVYLYDYSKMQLRGRNQNAVSIECKNKIHIGRQAQIDLNCCGNAETYDEHGFPVSTKLYGPKFAWGKSAAVIGDKHWLNDEPSGAVINPNLFFTERLVGNCGEASHRRLEDYAVSAINEEFVSRITLNYNDAVNVSNQKKVIEWKAGESLSINFKQNVSVQSFTLCADDCTSLSTYGKSGDLYFSDYTFKNGAQTFLIPKKHQRYVRAFYLFNQNKDGVSIKFKSIKMKAIQDNIKIEKSGGTGGGCIKLKANEIVLGLDTKLSANGEDGLIYGASGGAAGSIVIDCNVLSLSKTYSISCVGGKANNALTSSNDDDTLLKVDADATAQEIKSMFSFMKTKAKSDGVALQTSKAKKSKGKRNRNSKTSATDYDIVTMKQNNQVPTLVIKQGEDGKNGYIFVCAKSISVDGEKIEHLHVTDLECEPQAVLL